MLPICTSRGVGVRDLSLRQQFLGVAPGGGAVGPAGQHARQLDHPGWTRDLAGGSNGPISDHFFLHDQVPVRECSHLGQVGNH
jgi:hypothetical protein